MTEGIALYGVPGDNKIRGRDALTADKREGSMAMEMNVEMEMEAKMDMSLVHAPPDGQALLYERPGRYGAALEEIYGERFRRYRADWRSRGLGEDCGDFPLSLDFSINSGCQLNCVMCPLPAKFKHGRKNDIPLPLFRRLLSEGREHGLPAITLGLGSEPLLNRDLLTVLDISGRFGIMDIRLGTNGLLLTPGLTDSILDSPLTRLEVSVDAAGPESYLAVRGGCYDSLVKKIELFLDKRERRLQTFPLLRLSFLVLEKNRGELDAFIELWKDRADMLSIQKPIWYPESRLPKTDFPAVSGSRTCGQPWQRLSVLEDGAVWPCCSWYGESLMSGNLNVSSVNGLWQSHEMERLRDKLRNGNPPLPCLTCLNAGAA